MNIVKKSIVLSFSSLLVISHAQCMKEEEEDNKFIINYSNKMQSNKIDKNQKKRPHSPEKEIKEKEEIKKLKKFQSEMDISSLDDSLEEISINPIFSLDDFNQYLSIKTIAKYLIFKEASRLKKFEELKIKPVGEKIDQLKLQKMLHYAQSYFYALYGETLFNENAGLSSNGFYFKKLESFDFYNKHGVNEMIPLVQKDDINNYISLYYKIEKNLSENIKKFLDVIYDYFLNLSGSKLSDKNRKELIFLTYWNKNKGKDEQIPLESLVYYRQTKELAELQKLWIRQSFEKNDLLTMKKNIDWIINNSNIEDGLSYLTSIQETIEQTEESERPNLLVEKWKGQTYSESVLSTLLFPYALREEDEPLNSVLLQRSIPTILTFLSKKNNPEARYYLSKFLNIFYSKSEEKEFKEKNKEFYKLKNNLYEKCSVEFEQQSKENDNPFLKGMSFLYLEEKEEAKEAFKKGYEGESKNFSCLYKIITLENNINNKKELWKLSEQLNQDNENHSSYEINCLQRILLDKGNFGELEEGLKAYIQACELGLGSGYLAIGKLLEEEERKELNQLKEFKNFLEKNSHLKTPSNFFKEAGNKGVLTGYQLAAYYEIDHNIDKEAEVLYRLQGENGDLFGYLKLAELYEKKNKKEKAIEFYLKAGFLTGGLDQASRLKPQAINSSVQVETFFKKIKDFLDK